MACSCIKANDKAFGTTHHCPKAELAFPSIKNNKQSANSFQERISRITVDITKKDNETLGLTVSGGADRGETPVIANIRQGSIAEKSDIFLIGDHINSINGISTSSLCHQEIVSLVKTSKPTITLIIDYELPEKQESLKDVRIKQTSISLNNPDKDENFGMVIRGGYCKDISKIRPLTVMHIRPGSLAERDGRVKPGDRIASIRNCKVDHLTTEMVIGLFREQQDQISFTIEYSVASVDMSAVSGRPIIVEIQKQVNERLGVSIATYHDASTNSQIFYIENIESGSVADRCGVLQIGQIITAIQDLRTDKMTIQDAIEALKSGQRERIKLRIIPNLHLDQIKWTQQDKTNLTTPHELQLLSAKDLQNFQQQEDPNNLNASNTESLVGSDPLDLQCNCSEIYINTNSNNSNNNNHQHNNNNRIIRQSDDYATTSSSLKHISQPIRRSQDDIDYYHQNSSGSYYKTQHSYPQNILSGQLSYSTRPKSVLGLETAEDILNFQNNHHQYYPSHQQQHHQDADYYQDYSNVLLSNQNKKEFLSKSTNALYSQSKLLFQNSSKSKSSINNNSTVTDINNNNTNATSTKNVPGLKIHWEEAQVTLSADNHHSFGIMLCNSSSTDDSSLTSRLDEYPRIAGLQPSKPAASCGLIVEGDLLKSVDGLSTIGRSLEHINAQLCTVALSATPRATVVLTTLYEVRRPDDPQLTLENTIFEICLKKQAGSLGINLQALVTRTSGEPLIISKVLSGSAASRCGCIEPGDLLLALDNQPIDKCSLAEAVHLLQSSSDCVTLRIKKGPSSRHQTPPQSDLGVFTVDLKRELPCQPWGIVISGTDDSTDQPILIDSINRDSLASGVVRLAPGDQLLSINGHSLRGCTLTQAMALLHQYPDRVRLTVLRQQSHWDDHNNATQMIETNLDSNVRYKFNTKSLGRNEIRSHNKSHDTQRSLVSSMTLPPIRNEKSAINESRQTQTDCNRPSGPETIWNLDPQSISSLSQLRTTSIDCAPTSSSNINKSQTNVIPSHISATSFLNTIQPPAAQHHTTESDSSDSQTTTHSLFAKSHRHYLLKSKENSISSTNNPHQLQQQPFLTHQSASFESNSSSATSCRDKHHSALYNQQPHGGANSASSSNSLLYMKQSNNNNTINNTNTTTSVSALASASRNKELSITEESPTVIEGSEIDSSQADILDSIQCPGCREAIENEWRSKEKLNESWNNDKRIARVHGNAVPMTVSLPSKVKARSDSMKSTGDKKSDFQLLDKYGTKRAGSEKDVSKATSLTKLATVHIERKNPTESFGIGVSEGLSPKGTFISAIKPNSPASNCETLQLYDEIIEVNGLSTENMRCCDVVTLISQSENHLELLIRKRQQISASTSTNTARTSPSTINTNTLPHPRQTGNSSGGQSRSSSLKRPPTSSSSAATAAAKSINNQQQQQSISHSSKQSSNSSHHLGKLSSNLKN